MASGSLTDTLRETLVVFEDSGVPLTTPEVANQLDLGRRSTYNRLERLAEHGRLETKKVGASARVWWRPPTNATARMSDWPVAAESLIDDVLDEADVGVFVLDENFEVAWINAATERYFDLDREQVLGRDKRQLVGEHITTVVDDSETFAETVLSTYDDNTYTEHFECHVRSGDGREERWLDHRSKPIESGAYAGGRVELYYDVTDRKRAERARQESRRQFESLVEAVEEYAILMLDTDGYVQTWNPGAEHIKGHAADEILREHFSTFYPEDARAAGVPKQNLSEAAQYGSIEVEGWRVRADGSRFWAHVTITAIRDDLGELLGYAKVTRDMTERREREQELRRERDLTEQLLETAPVRLAVFQDDGTIERMNSVARRQLGIDESELTEFSIEDLDVYDADGNKISAANHPISRVLETGEPVSDWLVQHEGPNGDRRWVSLTSTPLHDDAGNVERSVIAGKDVTELKQKEQQLERQRDELEQELATVFERVDDAFYALDEEFRFEYVNDTAETYLGKSESKLLGQNLWEALDVDEDALIIERFETALETQEPTSFERYSDPLGIWVSVSVYPSSSGFSVYFRDITERRERERDLEQSERRYRTLVEHFPNGAAILFDEDLQYLIAGGEAFDELDVSTEDLEGNSILEHLPAELLDTFEPRFHAVFEGQASEFEFEFNDQIRQFRIVPVRDESETVFAGLAISQDVTQHRKHERELERQHEQLAALNNLYDIVRDITEAVIDQSTREEIEATVCERLAESDSYEFAWIAEVNPQTMALDPRVEAGVDGYLEEIPTSMDSDESSGQGPSGEALRSRDIQVTHDAMTDPDFEPWREHAKQYGYRSTAAIPIVHDKTLYGLLGVYADRPKAFENQEQNVIGQIGEVVGHAIAAIERKQALTSDEITEIEFTVPDIGEFAGIEMEIDGTISFDRAVPTGDGTYLEYGTVDNSAIDALEALVEQVSYFEEVSIGEQEADTARFKLWLSEPPVVSIVASHGGYLQQAAIDNGVFQLTIHLPVTVEARRIIDAVQDAYPPADLLKRRQITRSDDTLARVHQAVAADLTDRQRATLEAAYHAGFFEWPRDATGEEVAESLGIAPSTFSQHLRKAQQQVFESLFSTATPA